MTETSLADTLMAVWGFKRVEPDDRFVVYYKGRPALELNHRLIFSKQLADWQVEHIKALHVERLTWEDALEKATTPLSRRVILGIWRNIQKDLQISWGFEVDSNYWREHYLPGCTCAKLDNDELVGTAQRWVSSDCPYHGSARDV